MARSFRFFTGRHSLLFRRISNSSERFEEGEIQGLECVRENSHLLGEPRRKGANTNLNALGHRKPYDRLEIDIA
jgi:hypothetical protein